jgi:hypothetical protein
MREVEKDQEGGYRRGLYQDILLGIEEVDLRYQTLCQLVPL